MICSGELSPIRVPEETSSSTPKKKDIGSLSDYWQAWLLVDTQSGLQSGLDSATLLRRITPKSVFIAPVLPACAEGYHADKMGRCVKSISINATAHKDFILERLKLMFGNSQASKNDPKKSTGPLQLNIPLIPDINRQSANIEFDGTFSTNQPVVVPTRNETYFTRSEEKTKPHETNLYEVKNDTSLDKEESTFLLGNSNNEGRIDKKSPATVTIAELGEETNDTNFSEVVDYKIPIDLKALLNSSSLKRLNASDSTEESISMSKNQENTTETSPALVLLISPTKLTNVVDDLSLTQNDTAEQITQMSNFTSSTTTKENITEEASDSTTLPLTKQLVSLDEQRDNETYAEDEETSEPDEGVKEVSLEVEFIYDDEEDDYSYHTDVPNYEDSTEGEEILKHGEAGMTIPTRFIEPRVRDSERHQWQTRSKARNRTAELPKMLDVSDQVMIRFNGSASTEDKDEAGSNISSEVSIDGDFILETTLLDVNTERLQVTTQSPDVTEKIIKDRENSPKEAFSKSSNVVPEVVFSQDAHGAVSTNSHGRERTEQLSTRLENERNEEPEAAPSSSESLLYDSPEEDPIMEVRTINEKRSNAEESTLESSKDSQASNIPASGPKRTTMNLDSVEDFVRFPDYVKQPQQNNYVRFPSNEANSIHSLSYKQNSRYPADDVGPYDGTSTKSSVPIRQKPIYYLTASSWKSNRSQPDDHIQSTTSERQNRRPDLMRFWSKLPLIRDPAIYPIYQDDEATDDNQKQSHDRFFRARWSRRLNPFAETSPGNKVPTQKRRTLISV